MTFNCVFKIMRIQFFYSGFLWFNKSKENCRKPFDHLIERIKWAESYSPNSVEKIKPYEYFNYLMLNKALFDNAHSIFGCTLPIVAREIHVQLFNYFKNQNFRKKCYTRLKLQDPHLHFDFRLYQNYLIY